MGYKRFDKTVSGLIDQAAGLSSQQQLGEMPAEQVTTWDRSTSLVGGEEYRLVTLFAHAPSLDGLAFLKDAFGRERFYWSEPSTAGDSLTVAGVGIAVEIRIAPVLEGDNGPAPLPGYRFEEVAARARRLFDSAILRPVDSLGQIGAAGDWLGHVARPRLFGGFAFQDDFVPDNTWSVFSPAHFILPHFQFTDTGREAYLTINALVSPDEDFEESLNGLSQALLARLATVGQSRATQPINATDIYYPMSPEMWHNIVAAATGEIHEGALEKVVLSRVCEVRTGAPIDVSATLGYLNENYADSYRFIFEPSPNHAFFGATPELLLRKTGDRIQTMALAGSAARGQDPDLDETLGQSLLSSAKDRHEHQLVVNAIKSKLAEPTEALTMPAEPTLLRLRNIQHLLTPVEGRLHSPRTGILSLVRALHPTPAMGGVPAERALAFLRRAEPVPRGWYAAPIGWLDARNEGVFAVAIRSAVTQHARAWLYAGAGIVADSEPEREWAETALKFRPMLAALGIGEAG